MSERPRLRIVGHWRGSTSEDGLDPRDFLDPDWDEEERRLVADYLRGGRRWRQYVGSARCRLCGVEVGNVEQCDEVYAWPEGLLHYVEVHSLRPPAELVAHVRSETERLESRETDATWWRASTPTGTGRRWARHVLVLPLTAWARLVTVPEARRFPELAELTREGRLLCASAKEATVLGEELRSLGIEHRIEIEEIEAPDALY